MAKAIHPCRSKKKKSSSLKICEIRKLKLDTVNFTTCKEVCGQLKITGIKLVLKTSGHQDAEEDLGPSVQRLCSHLGAKALGEICHFC